MNRSGSETTQHALRKRYGDEIADIIARHTAPSVQAERPVAHSIKAALQTLATDPAAAAPKRVDALVRALLMEPAWRRLRVQSLEALTAAQLAECARYALDHFQPGRKPTVDRTHLAMTLALLVATRAWHAARRNNLLREALSMVFQVDYPRATAVIKKAHREFHGGTRTGAGPQTNAGSGVRARAVAQSGT